MKILNKAFTIFLITILINFCSNNDAEKKEKQQGRINTLLLLMYIQSYRSTNIAFDTIQGISEVLRDVYNNDVSTTPVDVIVNCSVSGTIRVTGTYTTSSNATTVDLDYTMNSCEFEQVNSYSGGSQATSKLTITGTISQSGTISSSDAYTKKLSGSSLTINGSVKNSKYPVNSPHNYNSETCDYSYTLEVASDSSSSSTGSVCGRSY